MPHIKIELVRVLSVMYKTFHKNSTVNMYYVNIKIKKKNTIGLAKRIVIFLHCSFPFCLGGRGSSPSAESRKFGFMAHSRGTAETCHILIFDY